jgi:23S rRNA (uracil1939-C5)-methyltransferase
VKGTVLEALRVIDMADEGRGLARHEGMVVFIDKAVPGDLVDVRIRKKQKSFLEAELIRIIEPSPDRVQPFCIHFGVCGGCKWQHLDYVAQLRYKEKQVKDAMERLGKISDPPMLPIIGSQNDRFYRNKLDFSAADRKWLSAEEFAQKEIMDGPALGFHIPGKFDKVLDIKECHLQPDPSNAIRNEIRRYAIENNFTFINLRNRGGELRSVIIRNTLKGDLMAIVMVYECEEQKLKQLLEHLRRSFPQITSLLYVINPKANDTFHDLEVHCYHGEAFITEQMEDLQFRIGPKSFFQTNSRQSLVLYQIAREFAQLSGNERVYDLYTGTGTIANFVARNAAEVIGIEYVAASIEDAKLNSALNNISNTKFFAGDMKDMLTESFMQEHGKADVIITDPPRAGMHADVALRLSHSGAERIVYVSCNAATQARDLQLMSEQYEIVKLQPVDMFPHTAHVENVALLQRKF